VSNLRQCCPDGVPKLEREAAYYDQLDIGEEIKKPWHQIPGRRVTWYPALLLAEEGIFDIGCGYGHMAEMCRAFGMDYRRGIDFSWAACAAARYRNPGVEFHHADVFKSQALFALADYRTAMFVETFEHVYRDLELIRMVPKGRVVVATVPNYWTEGHCRWFANAAQVRSRYSTVLNVQRIIAEFAVSGSNQYYVLKGTRK
jgi:trans-aconitate methyltransferase